MRTALTIAGSDSGAGAGIQADLKTFAAHGVYGMSAITAVTAQNSLGVTMVEALPADLVTAQIEAVVSDFGVHAAKTGMLANAAIVEAVAAAVRDLEIPLLVVDPVMIAKSGDRLLDDEALGAMKMELIGQAFLVTPNIPEAETLTNIEIRTDDDQERSSAAHRRHGCHGRRHQRRPSAVEMTSRICCFTKASSSSFGIRACREGIRTARGARLRQRSRLIWRRVTRFATPFADAQRYVAEAIRHAPDLGRGHGPLGHFFTFKALK